ncbi:MAG TPA: RNA polymerase sigma factor [Bacillota bacterium]|nr:RNA polymerase sigma factor [Bacillota bacterium]NLU55612.1 RNA polymerase sigma factor [Bacillota bacterium]HOA91437.1 RNA polymerase sigma factor [Bacillota bacterium]HOP53855.1 RNA polymerase sigma factor [Bacillota bacterium]HPZ73353.1 RNA polymerase sigma factor [Bacillota bacterium]
MNISKGVDILGPCKDRNNMNQIDDALLIRQAKKGNQEAINSLVEKYADYTQKSVLKILHKMSRQGSYISDTYRSTGDIISDIEEDSWAIAHDVLIKAMRSIKNFEGRSKFTTWLWVIAENHVKTLMAQRRKKRDRLFLQHSENDEVANTIVELAGASSDSFVEGFEDKEVMEAVLRILYDDDFNPDQRDAILYFFVQELDQRTISEITGAKIGTVKKRIHDGLKKLRQKLAKEDLI